MGKAWLEAGGRALLLPRKKPYTKAKPVAARAVIA
jgi:hypothetical protein